MVRAAAASEDRSMFPDAFIPRGQVPATAARLHRAAAELRERAGSPYAVPTLPVTLAHLEDAFDELAATMRLLAAALLWHLRSVADTLTDARDGCLASRPWAHELLERAAPEPESGVLMSLPTAQRPSARRIVCGVDGSEQARHAASAALRLAERLGAPLTLVHVTRTVVPVDSLPALARPRLLRGRGCVRLPLGRLRRSRRGARGAARRACRGARRGLCRHRRRVDRGRVARPRGVARRRLGLRVRRRRAARALPGDDRAGARG